MDSSLATLPQTSALSGNTGTGMIEVHAPEKANVYINHILVGTGTVRKTFTRETTCEVRILQHNNALIRFALVVPNQLTLLKVDSPWER